MIKKMSIFATLAMVMGLLPQTNAATVDGNNVAVVTYANHETHEGAGSFVQTGDKTWAEHKAHNTPQEHATFTEIGRDENSVYLRKSDGAEVHLDLHRREVFVNGRMLYAISSPSMVAHDKSPRVQKAAEGGLRFGGYVTLKATATRWGGHDGYLSPCGNTGACGVGVTLRPDAEFNKHEPNSNLRRWQILGGKNGQPIRYGDTIKIKATATRWGGHDGYLSPCGSSGACGVGVTLRPDKEFTRHEPNSMLRDWTIRGGPNGQPVRSGALIELKAMATRWNGHDGYLSPCGSSGACGVNVTLRPDSEFNKHEPNSNLRKWRITAIP